MNRIVALCAAALCFTFTGCKKEEAQPAAAAPAKPVHSATAPKPDDTGLKTGPGVDAAKKVVYIGALNDESGPAATIGKPFAAGKRLLVRQVNAGGSGLLPEGWKLELIEKDHAYNPQNSVQLFGELQDQVLFIGTSFGTPNTLPLIEKLATENLVAFPASLSSEMARHQHTPPIGASYKVEAMRAMDWAVEQAGGADKVKAAIVYQGDDYGRDGIDGWMDAARHHGVKIVSQQTVAPGQKDYAAIVTALKRAGANYVLLTVLPSATGPILGTAAQLKFAPTWIGQTPAWVDRFFDPRVIPPQVFANFHWVTGLTYWGEDVAGMKDFLAVYEQHGKDLPKDFYTMVSYSQGRVQLDALKAAIASKDVTRAGYLAAFRALKDQTAGGLLQPLDLTRFPYETSTQTRILKPKLAEATWEEVAPYASPKAPVASSASGAQAP